jgi:hypothetical protein
MTVSIKNMRSIYNVKKYRVCSKYLLFSGESHADDVVVEEDHEEVAGAFGDQEEVVGAFGDHEEEVFVRGFETQWLLLGTQAFEAFGNGAESLAGPRGKATDADDTDP